MMPRRRSPQLVPIPSERRGDDTIVIVETIDSLKEFERILHVLTLDESLL
jgi:hypothetical protein